MTPVQLSRRSFSVAAGGAAAATLAMPAWAVADQRPGAARRPRLTPQDRQIISKLQPENALQHLRVLTEDIGQRYSGTPAENQAAEYIFETLSSYGYDVEKQRVDNIPARTTIDLRSDALSDLICWGLAVSSAGANSGEFSGELVLGGDPNGSDLPADLTGKIVVYISGHYSLGTALAKIVQARHGAGLVEMAPTTEGRHQTAARAPYMFNVVGEFSFPIAGAGEVQQQQIMAALANGTVSATLSAKHYPKALSYNVLARRDGTKGSSQLHRPEVMVCAHYDSVQGSRGADDDGSGTVLTMELARVLKDLPTTANLQFSLWGSEEIGLYGSRQYARALTNEQKANLLGVFNNDMVGTSYGPSNKYWVLTYIGDPNPVNAEVLAAGERLGYRSQMSDVTQRGASDHQSFEEVGVASGNFSWRAWETPAELEPAYHSADDTIAENISMERLTIAMEIQGCAAYALAQ